MRGLFCILMFCTTMFLSCTHVNPPSVSRKLHVRFPSYMQFLNIDNIDGKVFGLAVIDSINTLEYVEFEFDNDKVALIRNELPFTKDRFDWSNLFPTQISGVNDSLILITLKHDKFFILDINQKSLNEFSLPSTISKENYSYESKIDRKAKLIGNKMYFIYCPVIRGKEAAEAYFSYIHPVGVYDLEHDSLYTCPISFPNKYKEEYYYDYFPYFDYSDSCIVVSYGVSDSIYFISKTGEIDSYLAPSSRKPTFESISHKEVKDLTILKQYMFAQPRYSGVIYDKYRNWTYRIIRFGVGKDKVWNLMIFDSNCIRLYEFEFLSNQYNQIVMPIESGIILYKTNVLKKRVASIDFSFIDL